ncbi:hypothetical protein POL68_33090 [Stigmatella sp. ncwal1]|uniref:Uncharacterized protein n=1 Tax=Stigmatella ashevillensis TaxID=2995309 RepID=A0ABT5DII7_9BACT|nr:hypothetical protein [Stigmatella ashevillena]MDC0713346.1 hypothetical protein [Stigmatella ashevillena]
MNTGQLAPLEQVLSSAYQGLDQALPQDEVLLQAKLATPPLDTATEFEQFLHRKRADVAGHFRISRAEGSAQLAFQAGANFIKDHPYDPKAPLKQFALVDVTGTINGKPVDYQAIVARFEFKPGTCEISLIDPMVPDAELYLPEEGLKALFPQCATPLESKIAFILRNKPDKQFMKYDRNTDRFTFADKYETQAVPADTQRGSRSTATSNLEACPKSSNPIDHGDNTTRVCSDSIWGYGVWWRGGKATAEVVCEPVPETEGSGCRVSSVTATGNQWSELKPGDQYDAGCLLDYGAAVEGAPGAANLVSQDGLTTGGHVQISKAAVVWRTTESQTRSGVKLGGQCAGKADAPNHGVTGQGNLDFHSDTEVHQNQSKIDQLNFEVSAVQLCYKSPRPSCDTCHAPKPGPSSALAACPELLRRQRPSPR